MLGFFGRGFLVVDRLEHLLVQRNNIRVISPVRSKFPTKTAKTPKSAKEMTVSKVRDETRVRVESQYIFEDILALFATEASARHTPSTKTPLTIRRRGQT